MLRATGVLAHQGGWDEALMVLTPLGLFAGLWWLAVKRHPADGGDPAGPAGRKDRPSAP